VQDYDRVRPLIDELALAAEDLGLSADELKGLLVKATPEYTPFITTRVETSCVEVRGFIGERPAGVLPELHGIAPDHS
jgi:hypothetical protein